jgi:succinate dehydrogenase / fumarate reductase, cytochrome b subunit
MSSAGSTRPLWWARLASLLSVLPLGVWTINHLWDNLAAFSGPEAWQRAVTTHPHPLAQGVTYAVVLLPLLLHSVWGVQRLLGFTPNNLRYPSANNLKYLLQRLSAIGLALFLGAHLWLALLRPRLVEGRAEPFEDLAREMHFHGPTLLVYLLGTLAVSYHLANGLFSFAWTWGLVGGRSAFRRADLFSIFFGLALWALSWTAIYGLWTAGGQLGP